MLKISIIENPMEQIIILEGSLNERYIQEMEEVWKKACSADPGRRRIVDLRNTTFIDQKCEEVLLRMKREGALFIACGISTTHQLKDLGILCQGSLDKLH
jgi:anti-anti-sigma regulatory factor